MATISALKNDIKRRAKQELPGHWGAGNKDSKLKSYPQSYPHMGQAGRTSGIQLDLTGSNQFKPNQRLSGNICALCWLGRGLTRGPWRRKNCFVEHALSDAIGITGLHEAHGDRRTLKVELERYAASGSDI